MERDELGAVRQGTPLWEPPADARARSRMGRWMDRMEATRGLDLPDYDAAWRWSVEDLDGFWASIVDEFDVRLHAPAPAVLARPSLPGAVWLPGATLNYAEHALRRRDDAPAVVARSQTRPPQVLTWAELADQVGRAAAGLRRLGVRRGDRVAAYAPNIPETLVAFLACASVGAVWSSCAPEFGVRSVVDRIRQIDPVVLLAVDGYRYGQRVVERHAEVAAIREALPTLRATVVVGYLDADGASRVPDALAWEGLLAEPDAAAGSAGATGPSFEPVTFDHPLYVLFSSGTTGLPKAIVHGHGGILLEHLKMMGLHHDLGDDDRLLWFTTTGWMMWNYLVSGLTVGACIVLFDGDPGQPDLSTLWRIAAEEEVDVLGVGAPFLLACRRAGLRPRQELDTSHLRAVCSTASPLPPEGFAWVHEHVGEHVQIVSMSGGTDLCTAFVAGAPLVGVRAGEIPCRCLGARVEAFDAGGCPVIGQRGELVLTAPMPSMPVGFLGDADGSAYRAAYFDRFDGAWAHGDWIEITEHGGCVITGRSDATLNRGGVRMGTSELYSVVESVPGVLDSLIVHRNATDELVLFVVLAEGDELDDEVRGAIATAVRTQLSPRHVPDVVHRIPSVPRTISGKKMEVPVKRLLDGAPLASVATPGAMADPTSLDALLAVLHRS